MPPELAVGDARSGQHRVWLALLWGIGLAGVLFPLLSPRIWSPNFLDERDGLIAPWHLLRALRQLTLLGSILLVCWAVAEGLRRPRLRRAGFGLWITALAYLVLSHLSTFFGTEPGFHLSLLTVPPALTAAYLLEPLPLPVFIRHAKAVCLVYVYGSLTAVAIAPEWALEHPYDEGLLPGMPWRLHGLATHSNVLSPFLLIYLLLDLYAFRHTATSWTHRVSALACLVLTQSKTALGVLVFVLVVHRMCLAWRERTLKHYLQVSSGLLILVGAMFYLVATHDTTGLLMSNPSLTTLTGRTDIWHATIEIWRDNPWFGYGPTLFHLDMTPDYFGYALEDRRLVVSAHNQFFQTLGASGAVGVVGLVAYSLCLTVHAARCFAATHGISLALVLALLISGMSEPSLDAFSLGGSPLFYAFVVFSVILLSARGSGPRCAHTS